MQSFVKVAALAGTALLAASAPASAQLLRYDEEPGAERSYVRVQEDEVVQTVNGAEQRLSIDSYWRFKTKVLEAGDGERTIEVLHDSVSVTGAPGAPTDFSAVYDEPVVLVLGERGEVGEVSLPESLPAELARLDLETTYRTFYPTLPAATVEPGMSWSDSLTVTTDQNGLVIEVLRVNEYTAGGTVDRDGIEAVQVDYATTLDLAGSGAQQGNDIAVEGGGTGSGSFWFDPAAGAFLGGEETSEVRMDAFVTTPGGQNLLIPIVQNRSERIALVEP